MPLCFSGPLQEQKKKIHTHTDLHVLHEKIRFKPVHVHQHTAPSVVDTIHSDNWNLPVHDTRFSSHSFRRRKKNENLPPPGPVHASLVGTAPLHNFPSRKIAVIINFELLHTKTTRAGAVARSAREFLACNSTHRKRTKTALQMAHRLIKTSVFFIFILPKPKFKNKL